VENKTYDVLNGLVFKTFNDHYLCES